MIDLLKELFNLKLIDIPERNMHLLTKERKAALEAIGRGIRLQKISIILMLLSFLLSLVCLPICIYTSNWFYFYIPLNIGCFGLWLLTIYNHIYGTIPFGLFAVFLSSIVMILLLIDEISIIFGLSY